MSKRIHNLLIIMVILFIGVISFNCEIPATPDTQAPTVYITNPPNGATVSGIFTIKADAMDNNEVEKVEFYIDGNLKSTDISSPFEYYWNSTAYTNTLHTIMAKAYDATNNVGSSSVITVIVNNESTEDPVLSVSPTSLAFGTSSTNMTFTISNAGGGTLSWDVSENPGESWITSVLPASGTNGETITVQASRSGLSAGTYNGTVSVTSNGGNQDVSVSITVTSTDIPSTTVAVTDSSCGEPSETGVFSITLSPAPTSTVNVNYVITGTATNGTDYTLTPSSSPITFTAGQTSKTVTITPIDDTAVESTETVILTLQSGTDYSVGSPSSTTIDLSDDDVPPNPVTSPSPSNGATNVPVTADLSWVNGGGSTNYDVYFGTDATPDSGEFQGNQTGTSLSLGTLSYSTTYYWRIDAKNSTGTTTGSVWSFTTEVALPNKATSPSPSNGATNVPVTADLSWVNGGGSTNYDVYFGTDATPDSGEFQGNQTGTSLSLGTLSYSTTYYWRVDAKNSTGMTTGDVWSFITQAAPCTLSPTISSSPVPSDNANGISISANLSWSGGNSQCGFGLTYSVYFGTDLTPDSGELQGTTVIKSWDLPTLSYSTHYYWRVVATDSNGSTSSPTWDFITASTPQVMLTTTKRGYVTSTGWENISSAMYVGFVDYVAPLNDVNHRAYAWFDIPQTVRSGTIVSATLQVQANVFEWNELLVFVDMRSLGSLSWNTFYNDDFGSGWDDGHWDLLPNGMLEDWVSTANTILSFDISPTTLQAKSQMGFSFIAVPDVPTLTWSDDSHRITISNPTLIITYIP